MRDLSLTGYEEGLTTTVASLTGNLAELVGSMMASDRSLVAVAEFSDHRYVQFLVRPGEGVYGEVISNLNIGDQVALSGENEDLLRALGFEEPSPGASPNWWFLADDGPSFVRLMGMMNHAIRRVLRESAGNAVEVRSWPAEIPTGMQTSEFRMVKRVYYEGQSLEPADDDGDGDASRMP